MTSEERLYDVLRQVRPVHQLSARLVTERLRDHDLTMPMRAVLELLHDRGPATVPQVARDLFITRQGVQTVVDDARGLGLVELGANPAHRRSHLVTLTAGGRDAYTELHRRELTDLNRIGEGLDPEDIEATVRVLAHLAPAIRDLVEEDS